MSHKFWHQKHLPEIFKHLEAIPELFFGAGHTEPLTWAVESSFKFSTGLGSSQQPKTWIFPAPVPSFEGSERDEKGLEAKLVLFSWVI